MAEIIIPGPISGQSYGFRIKGDAPTVDEQMWIDNRIRQKEAAFQIEYTAAFGAPVETGEGEGIANYLGEIPKGIARGAVGMFESALLGGAAALPERYEAPAREGIRSLAYSLKPQADMGMENTVGGTFGEALGSFGALGLTTLIPGGQFLAPALAVGAGSGEASERARAAGATEKERGIAALMGAPVGALELLPIKFIKVLGKPATGTIVNRLTRAAAEGGVEGAQEAATTIAQNLIEQGVYNPEKGTFSDTGEALGYGAGVGALVQGLLDLLPGRTATPPAASIDPATLQTQLELPLTPSTRPGFITGQEQGELFLPTSPAAGGSVRPATPPAEIIPNDLRLGAGVYTDNDFIKTHKIYNERLAMALDSGASAGEAAQTAARSTVNYIDGLQEETKQRLARFRSTMERRARASVGGVMPPDLPDSAYASEFSDTTQDELFTADNTENNAREPYNGRYTQKSPSVGPTVTPREDYAPLETDEEAFTRAAQLGTRTAAPMVKPAPAAPAVEAPQATDTPQAEVPRVDEVITDIASAWDAQNRNNRSNSWFEGKITAGKAFDAIQKEGNFIPAHGMSKVATLSEGLQNLTTLLDGGIDPNRALYTAPLTAVPGSSSTTPGGYAYRDGPFIVTFRQGLAGPPTSADITGVLVNPAHAEIATELQTKYPNLTIRTFDAVADVVAASKSAAPQAATQAKTPKSDVVSEYTVGPEGLTVVHGGKPGLTVEDVKIIRPADQMTQGKKGRVFGGFYATSEADVNQAEGYAGKEGELYNAQIRPGTKVAQREGSIERLSEQTINQYVADGYGVVYGKDVRGRTEFVVLDKSAIGDLAPRRPQAAPQVAKSEVLPAETVPGIVPAESPVPVLTDELVTQLGVGTAKSATLRKMVGKPLTDSAVISKLASWAQNPKATAENKALAARLITGQPDKLPWALEGDELAAVEAEYNRQLDAAIAATPVSKKYTGPKPVIPVLYRGLSRSDLSEEQKVSPNPGYNNREDGVAVFATQNPDKAASYSGANGEVVPIQVDAMELIEFPAEPRIIGGREYPTFDMFEFDKRAAQLGPGQVLVARNVQDLGPNLAPAVVADAQRYKNATSLSDVYAIGRGTPIKKVTPEVADVPEAAAVKPEEVGTELSPLSRLEEQLVAARAEAAALRKKVPAGVLQRELVGGAVDPALAKTVTNLQNVLARQENAAETAKNAVPKKPTHPARPKKLKAYEDALAKATDTRGQLAAARATLSAAELVADLQRGAQPKKRATGKAAVAYTNYVKALRRADVIRQQVDSTRAREARSVEQMMRDLEPTTEKQAALDFSPPYDAGTGAARQYIPGTITPVNKSTLQPIGAPRMERSDVYASDRPTPAQRVTAQQLDEALAARYETQTSPDVKRGAKFLNERGVQAITADKLTIADKQVVINLLATRDDLLSPQAKAAKLYFSKVARPMEAVLMVVDDLTAPYGKYRAEPDADPYTRAFLSQTGTEAANQALNFIKTRMSKELNRDVTFRQSLSAQQDENIEILVDALDRVELKRGARKRARSARVEAARESGYISEPMSTHPLAALDRSLHYSVRMALDHGDLRLALRALSATTHNADLAALAARFADFTGTTRVKVLYPGDPLMRNINSYLGVYWAAPDSSDPERTNIIYLNGQMGMSAHVLMHEMAHAVTANLSFMQPNHPTIKQLESLLNFLRSKVSPPNLQGEYSAEFYGLTNLQEFMAEAYGRVAMGANDNGLRALMKRTLFVDYSSTQVELPLNVWERFKEIAGNLFRGFIGRPSKPYPRRTKTQTTKTSETGADRFHRLLDGLLSEAPHVLPDSVFQEAMSEPMVARTVLNNAIQNADPWSAAGRDRLAIQMQASIPMSARSTLLGLLQLEWFNDLAGEYFPEIAALKQIDDLRRGELVQMERRAERVLKDQLAYANTQPELYTTLMAIMGRATLAGVDPTKPRSTYNADPEKLRVWADLGNELRNSDSTGEMLRLFKTVRNMFAQFREDIKAVLGERVKDMTDDVATQNQLVARLLKKLDDENVIEPYFSLMRTGDFWLTYDADDTTAAAIVDPNTGVSRKPPTQFVQAFNSVWERDQFRAKLEATKDADGNPVARNFKDKPRPVGYNPDEKVPTAFAQGAINIITGLVPNMVDKAKGDAAVEAVMEMFSRFTPEHSILQSFNKRKGVRGFMGDITPIGVVDRPVDMVQALAEKSSSLAYQLMGMKYGARIQTLKNQSDATLKTLLESPYLNAGEQQAVKAYHEEFKARANFAQRPRVSQFTQGLRGITFGMTLGFNVAAGFNTIAQIPMIGTTELAGRYGMPASLRELGSATRVLFNAAKTKRVRSFGPDGMELATLPSVYGSLDNYFEVNDVGENVLRSDIKIPSKLRSKIANMGVLVEMLSANGMLISSMSQEMLQADAGWLQNLNKWSGFFQQTGERLNRQVMAIAAYNLELGKITGPISREAKITGPISREAKIAAAKKAIEITERVNGSIGASTAPRWAMGPVGSVVFMFKRFGLQMARYIINTANQALRGASKEDRAVARYQIIGMLGTTALFSGAQGLPFFGEFMALINLLFTDDDEEPAEVVIEKFLQEPFYHGALNYLTGAEIASRISMSGLIFRENKIEKNQSSLYDLVEMFGGPAVGVYMNVERGADLLSQGELYRGVEAMMPAAIKGVMKSVRFATEGATTLRTDEIIPVSNLDIALQAIAYTPGAYARQQERVSGEKRIDEAVRSNKRKLLRRYNLAFKDGDFSEVREVLKDIREFNKRHPEAGILPDTLEQSSRSFLQSSQSMLGGVSFSPSYLPRAKQSVYEEYDQDISLWGSE